MVLPERAPLNEIPCRAQRATLVGVFTFHSSLASFATKLAAQRYQALTRCHSIVVLQTGGKSLADVPVTGFLPYPCQVANLYPEEFSLAFETEKDFINLNSPKVL